MFIGRESELGALNQLYAKQTFQMFVLYGRRRVGKTTLLNEFCKNKPGIFFSAEQSNTKLNLEEFSSIVFNHYNEAYLEPFSSWKNTISYINERQQDEQLVLILDEFPYLAQLDKSLISVLQHLIDHSLKKGKLFIVLCGSYLGFMEKNVLGSKSPLFGRRTGQLHLKPFDYLTSTKMPNLEGDFINALTYYGIFGGTALYLSVIDSQKSLKENIIDIYMRTTGYLYEEPVFLLKQEVNEPNVYMAILSAIAGGASKASEIAQKTGEESSKCLKYISTLNELGLVKKEAPFGDKIASRKTLYSLSDNMFRFWFKFISSNRSLIETGTQEIMWSKVVEPQLDTYMGLVFEQICMQYMLRLNSHGKLPIIATSIGRWWGTNNLTRLQMEIDIVAGSSNGELIFGECKWRNELLGSGVLNGLREKIKAFPIECDRHWIYLFSKSGFTKELMQETENDPGVVLVKLNDLLCD